MISHALAANLSMMVSKNNSGHCHIKRLIMLFSTSKSMATGVCYRNKISKTPFARFQSVLLITGYSFSNGTGRCTSISSSHLDCEQLHSSSTSLAKLCTGLLILFSFFGAIASYLCLAENTKKRKDGWVVDFTGIELDSNQMVARLPKDKHDRATHAVQRLLTTGAVTHRTLEKLLGFLSFCARVIPLGRPFLRNLFNLLQRLSHLHPMLCVILLPLHVETCSGG